MLKLVDVTVNFESKNILKNVSLSVPAGKICALMGPNGSGKSTLSLALAGHPLYQLDGGSKIFINSVDLTTLTPEDRAKQGLFLCFQYPIAIPGLSVKQLLKSINDHLHPGSKTISALRQQLTEYASWLQISEDFLNRSINDGFSGGEKKRLEMLQMLVAKPKVAILDEIDSGLDVDAIKLIAKTLNYAKENFNTSCIIVTHYRRILEYIQPDNVLVLKKGQLIKSGGPRLLDYIDQHGYKDLKNLDLEN